MKKLLISLLSVGILSGCYTQLLTGQNAPPAPAVQKLSYIIDTVTNDTIKVLHQTDTVLARDNQNCYWTRDIWGQPVLRCDGAYYSNYSSNWNMYYNSPWWYEQDMYGHYYNNYNGFGWNRHRNYYNPYYYSGSGNTGGTPAVSPTGNRSLRRTSSSAVPKDYQRGTTSAPQSKTMRADAPPPSQPVVRNSGSTTPSENKPAAAPDNNSRRKPNRSW